MGGRSARRARKASSPLTTKLNHANSGLGKYFMHMRVHRHTHARMHAGLVKTKQNDLTSKYALILIGKCAVYHVQEAAKDLTLK